MKNINITQSWKSLLPLLLFSLLAMNSPAATAFRGTSVSQGPFCASTFPLQFLAASNSLVPGTYTVSLTAGGTVFPLSAPVLNLPDSVNVVFDLTSLTPGAGTITIVETTAVPPMTSTFPFTISTCPGGSGMQIRLFGTPLASPSFPWPYVLSVVNLGPGASLATTVLVSGIPNPPDMVMVSPGGSTLVSPTLTTQGFTLNVPSLAVGSMANFLFTLNPGVSALGFTYPVQASFTSVYLGFDTVPVRVVSSFDPNNKTGPAGVGPGHYLQVNATLPYQISFENDPVLALAPAQQVFISDQLDVTKVDLGAFLFGPMTFGNQIVTPPFGVNPFTMNVPYDVDGNPLTTADNLTVQIDGSLDLNPFSSTYGQVSWFFQSFDSSGFPPSPGIGFLPPNITAPEGDGTVSFTISPLPGLVTGDLITNRATIIFDANTPILTGTWTNTLDLSPPMSSVTALPVSQNISTFTVSWSGVDPDSGLANYDILVSDNAGPYLPWLTGTILTTAPYNGVNNHTYRFYSIARDFLGNVEITPASADATTAVVAPTLQILSTSGGMMSLVWANGVLEEAPALGIPALWTPVVTQVSPINIPMTVGNKFFRVRNP